MFFVRLLVSCLKSVKLEYRNWAHVQLQNINAQIHRFIEWTISSNLMNNISCTIVASFWRTVFVIW